MSKIRVCRTFASHSSGKDFRRRAGGNFRAASAEIRVVVLRGEFCGSRAYGVCRRSGEEVDCGHSQTS